MKNVLKFVLFLIIVISIFFIENVKILGLIFIAYFGIAFSFKISLKKIFYSIKAFLPFLLFTVFVNLILDTPFYAFFMGLKILIAYNITYLFSQMMSISEMANAITIFMTPLKIFNINIQDISIIISIAICMISILRNEVTTTMMSLKSKGCKLSVRNLPLICKPLLI